MSLDREAILDALAARLTDAVEARTVSRRDQIFIDVPKPALLIRTASEERDDLGRWTIRIDVNVMVQVPGNDKAPEARLRKLIDQIDDALDAQLGETPGPGLRTSLGGLCESATLKGQIDMAQGVDGIGEAVVPIELVAYEH